MRKLLVILAMSLVLSGALAMSAQAAGPILAFDMSPTTPGTITYTAGGVLNGDSIQVDSITGIGTPANAGVPFPITCSLLFFETGAFSGPSPEELDFSTGNGFVHITGGVPEAGIPAGTQLLLNTALTSPPIPHVALGAGNIGGTVVINFTDDKDSLLLAFFGLTSFTEVGGSLNLQFSTATPIDPSGSTGFSTTTILSGVVVNNFAPLPGAVWLFGTGLAGLVGWKGFRKG